MSEKPLATPRGSHADNENSHLECQTGTSAHTEPKGQFGEVSNPAWEVSGDHYAVRHDGVHVAFEFSGNFPFAVSRKRNGKHEWLAGRVKAVRTFKTLAAAMFAADVSWPIR